MQMYERFLTCLSGKFTSNGIVPHLPVICEYTITFLNAISSGLIRGEYG